MTSKNFQVILICASILIIIAAALFGSEVFAAEITATIKITVCGDGVIASGEQCDGASLGGATCASRGFSAGALSCNSSCEFNVSACSNSSAPSGGGGGGGGIIAPVVTSIVFDGRAYPKSAVTLLKDAQIAATTVAGTDSIFK